MLPSDPPDAFDSTGADVLAGGHVHIQQLRRVGDADLRQPRERRRGYGSVEQDDFHFDSWASYAILERGSVAFHRVPFDIDELAAITRASGLPMADHTLSLYRQ